MQFLQIRYASIKIVAIIITYSMLMTLCAAETVTSGVVGNYIGMQMGRSEIHSQDETLNNSLGMPQLTKPSNNGFGVRFLWGYQFSTYAALEGGYAYYSPSIYNIDNGNSPELRVQAVDLLGKGLFPLYWGMSIFAKAGAAITFYKEGGLLAPNTTNGTDGSSGVTVRPEVGAGVSYALTPNWIVDLTATRILSGGVVPSTDLIAVGISYHFVDRYCGQFLC